MNPQIVGKRAVEIAKMADVNVPDETRVLLSRQTEVSRQNPYAREKLCPVLGYYVRDSWEEACDLCVAILQNEGAGHTMTIHAQNQEVIRAFARKKPVSRLLVNIRRVAFGVRELEEIRGNHPVPETACQNALMLEKSPQSEPVTRADVEAITRAVLARLGMA